MEQIFVLHQIFEKSWEYAKTVNAYLDDLEIAYNSISRDKLWAVLLYSKSFTVGMRLRQGCSLSPILFLIYVDRIVKKNESCGKVKIGECTVQRLLFADDLVLLDSTQNDLQQAFDRFLTACSVAGMKINTTTTETTYLSRHQSSALS